ncbi:centrosomal protein of 19 kDa [Sardina pilchardus]|uniref:centrosomal protein of 19 kDa n=1 Tax=Sardina pilchardus TaxID=27697 RepID=UPI002E10D61F
MPFVAKRCGVNFSPPSVVVIYEDKSTSKMRKRVIPVRNFSQFSDCSKAAERLKHNPRHRDYLESISVSQLEKLHVRLREHMRGLTPEQSLAGLQNEDPYEEDLNKLSDEDLAHRKAQMDKVFERNRKQRGDPDFVYDLEVEFPEIESQGACSWDDESDDGF